MYQVRTNAIEKKIKGIVWVSGPEGMCLEGNLILSRVVIQNLSVKVFSEQKIKEDQQVIYVDFMGYSVISGAGYIILGEQCKMKMRTSIQ